MANNIYEEPAKAATKDVRVLRIETRWKAKQVAERTIEIEIPTGGMHPVISEQWAESMRLTDAEYMKAEELVLRSLIVL